MDAVLFGVLAGGVQEYLRGVLGEPAPGAGSGEARRLAAAWRALLHQHSLGHDGRCQCCGRGRWVARSPWDAVAATGPGFGARVSWLMRLGWWPVRRPQAGLCTVWQVAVAYFIRRLPNGER
ncbi:hypothetical protein [Amycolatopsis sp. NPDC051903]|uniref:hypothetical protein n=1 Tax=Amycolatopsis sp. NPDC051903 TaxID=3363936 RepID=UPI0037B10EE0